MTMRAIRDIPIDADGASAGLRAWQTPKVIVSELAGAETDPGIGADGINPPGSTASAIS